jgi:hypothetical protein
MTEQDEKPYPASFMEFLRQEFKQFVFSGKDYKGEDFKNGDYALTAAQLDAAEKMAELVLKKAAERNINITQFPEVRAAMDYNQNPDNLTAAELGSLLIGIASERFTYFSGDDARTLQNLHSRAPSINRIAEDSSSLGEEIGRQIYGDTNPGFSSTDTSTAESMKPILQRARKIGP